MKQLLLIILVLPFISFSQCPPDGTFNSQAEIDALVTDYPDCTQLGGLIIEGDDITDLSGLNQITNASSLYINNNPLLETLDGINTSLVVYAELQPTFSIINNASLTDISALTSTSVSAGVDMYVNIIDNPMLASLNGLQSIVWATTFQIVNNDSLTNLVGLGSNIFELLYIDANDSLIDLSGLHFMGEYLVISNNESLQSFNTQGITSALYLTINNNPNLTDINFPENSGAESLTIENNMNLSVCNVDFICNYLISEPPLFAVQINNNAPGCNSYEEVEYACGQIPRNDECESNYPRFIEIGETFAINNELATTSAQTPSCNEVTDRRDLWFRFNSGALTSVDVITETGFNLQLWEGDCNNLTQVDNACNSVELLDIPVSTNTIYIVQVWSDTNKRPAGWFDLLVQDGLLSTQEDAFTSFSLYPNPVNNMLHLRASNTISSIGIYNLLGQRVNEIYPNTLEAQLNTESLQSGIYLVEVTIGEQKATYKIVK